MKVCRACGIEKPSNQYRRSPVNVDGLWSWCIDCHRQKDREYKRKKREREGKEETRRKWRQWYANNREYRRNYTSIIRILNPLKKNARSAVEYAIKTGILVRPNTCSKCEISCKPDAHHEDHEVYLDVIWLCKSCHGELQIIGSVS